MLRISLFVYSSTIYLNECHDWSVVEGNHDIIHLLDRWEYMGSRYAICYLVPHFTRVSLPNIWKIISMKGYERNGHLLINIMFSRVDVCLPKEFRFWNSTMLGDVLMYPSPPDPMMTLIMGAHGTYMKLQDGHPLVMSGGASSNLIVFIGPITLFMGGLQ